MEDIQSKLEQAVKQFPELSESHEYNQLDYIGLDMGATHGGDGKEETKHKNRERCRKKNFNLITKIFPEETKDLNLKNFKLNCWKGAMFWGDWSDYSESMQWYGETSANIISTILEIKPWDLFTQGVGNSELGWKMYLEEMINKDIENKPREVLEELGNTQNLIIESSFDNLLIKTKPNFLLDFEHLLFESLLLILGQTKGIFHLLNLFFLWCYILIHDIQPNKNYHLI